MQIARPQGVQTIGSDIRDAAGSGNKGRNQVLGIIDGALIHPVQAIVERQFGSHLPAVLTKKGKSVEIIDALLVAVGDPGVTGRDAAGEEIRECVERSSDR